MTASSLVMADTGAVTFAAWPTTRLLGVFITAILIYFVVSVVYSWSRLRNVPGPFIAGFSSLWELSTTATGQEAWIYNDLAKKYGHLIRISPNTVLTDDPEVLKRISGARGTYSKDAFYSASFKLPDHDTMFSTIDTSTHDAIKAKLAGPYGGRETSAMEPIVDDMVKSFTQHLRDQTSRGPAQTCVVNFAHVVMYFTMDVITRVSFGRELGFLRTGSDVFGLMEAARSSIRKYTIPMSIPWLRSITTSKYFLRAFGPKPTDKEGPGLVIRQV